MVLSDVSALCRRIYKHEMSCCFNDPHVNCLGTVGKTKVGSRLRFGVLAICLGFLDPVHAGCSHGGRTFTAAFRSPPLEKGDLSVASRGLGRRGDSPECGHGTRADLGTRELVKLPQTRFSFPLSEAQLMTRRCCSTTMSPHPCATAADKLSSKPNQTNEL